MLMFLCNSSIGRHVKNNHLFVFNCISDQVGSDTPKLYHLFLPIHDTIQEMIKK